MQSQQTSKIKNVKNRKKITPRGARGKRGLYEISEVVGAADVRGLLQDHGLGGGGQRHVRMQLAEGLMRGGEGCWHTSQHRQVSVRKTGLGSNPIGA